MANNIYKFRKVKWADPKRLKMIRPFKKRRSSRYLSGFVVLCIAFGFAAVQAWPRLMDGIGTNATPMG